MKFPKTIYYTIYNKMYLFEIIQIDNLLNYSEKLFNPPETTDWAHVRSDEFSRWSINMISNTVTKSLFVNSINNTFVNMLDYDQ